MTIRFCGLLLSTLLSAGCAGVSDKIDSAPGTLDPSKLSPGHGYLAVGYDTDGPVRAVRIQRSIDRLDTVLSSRIKEGVTRRFYSLPAGHYRFTRILNFYHRGYQSYFELDPDSDYWVFEITPGKVNYIGDLVVDRGLGGFDGDLRRAARSAMLYRHIEDKESVQLEKLDIVYSGPGRDQFLQFILTREGRDGE